MTFEALFPEYLQSCAKLYNAFIPYAFAVLVASFAFEFSRGPIELPQLLRFITKLLLIVLLIGKAHEIINTGQLAVEDLIDKTGLVRPETLAQNYKSRLAEAVNDPGVSGSSLWELMVSGRFVDAVFYLLLVIISFAALAIIATITFVQKCALFVSWACCPILFALLGIRPLAHLGSAHIQRLIALICWPLGWTVASTSSDALLQIAINDRFVGDTSFVRTLGTTIESLLIMLFIGVWSVASLIFAPIIVHRFLVGYQPGTADYIARGHNTSFSAVSSVVAGAVSRAAVYVRERTSRPRNYVPDDMSSSLPSLPHSPSAEATGPSIKTTPSPISDPTGSKELKELLNKQ